MTIPWGIIIALLVLGLAYLIKHFGLEIIEDENDFLKLIGIFLLIYVGAAIAVGVFNPKNALSSSISPVMSAIEEEVVRPDAS